MHLANILFFHCNDTVQRGNVKNVEEVQELFIFETYLFSHVGEGKKKLSEPNEILLCMWWYTASSSIQPAESGLFSWRVSDTEEKVYTSAEAEWIKATAIEAVKLSNREVRGSIPEWVTAMWVFHPLAVQGYPTWTELLSKLLSW